MGFGVYDEEEHYKRENNQVPDIDESSSEELDRHEGDLEVNAGASTDELLDKFQEMK